MPHGPVCGAVSDKALKSVLFPIHRITVGSKKLNLTAILLSLYPSRIPCNKV